MNDIDIKTIAQDLFKYKNDNGKKWKSKLIDEHWEKDGNIPSLRRLRNYFNINAIASKISKCVSTDELEALLTGNHESFMKGSR